MKKQIEKKNKEIEELKNYISDLEVSRNKKQEESDYYREQLAKSHEILGRVLHQTSERWDSVNITSYYPTDNLWRKRTIHNPSGKSN
jgi:chromosome segregation ATPase